MTEETVFGVPPSEVQLFRLWTRRRRFVDNIAKETKDQTPAADAPGYLYDGGFWIAHHIEEDGFWRGFYHARIGTWSDTQLSRDGLERQLWVEARQTVLQSIEDASSPDDGFSILPYAEHYEEAMMQAGYPELKLDPRTIPWREYGNASDHRAMLRAVMNIGGNHHHIEARAAWLRLQSGALVPYDPAAGAPPDATFEIECPHGSTEFTASVYNTFSMDGALSTVEIAGRHYVILLYPYCD